MREFIFRGFTVISLLIAASYSIAQDLVWLDIALSDVFDEYSIELNKQTIMVAGLASAVSEVDLQEKIVKALCAHETLKTVEVSYGLQQYNVFGIVEEENSNYIQISQIGQRQDEQEKIAINDSSCTVVLVGDPD